MRRCLAGLRDARGSRGAIGGAVVSALPNPCRCGDHFADHRALPGGERGRCEVCPCPEYRVDVDRQSLGHLVAAEPISAHACWRPRHDDFQTVSIAPNSPLALSTVPSVYVGGKLIPLAPQCSHCGKAWGLGHVAQISNFDLRWRHTDCGDPKLERLDEDEWWLRNVVG